MTRLVHLSKVLVFTAWFSALYLLVAYLGMKLSGFNITSPWWLPSVLGYVIILRRGARWLPLIALLEAVNGVWFFNEPAGLDTAVQATLLKVAYVLPALVIRRRFGELIDSRRLRDLTWILAGGVLVGASLSAIIGIGWQLRHGTLPREEFWSHVIQWWAGDAVGVFALAPLLMVRHPTRRELTPVRLPAMETVAQLVLLTGIAFLAALLGGQQEKYLYVSFLPLLWIALRRGFLATTAAALWIDLVATLGLAFTEASQLDMAYLQLFISALAVTGAYTGAIVTQNLALTNQLEARIRARTAELAAVNDKLLHQATHDALTGLTNRAGFYDALAIRLATPSVRTAVLSIDLDGFKAVNDRHGHSVGDQLLVAVARRLEEAVREGDLVGRLGGDEFAILMPEADAEIADQVRERVTSSLGGSFSIRDRILQIGASVGSVTALDGEDVDDLLARADHLMYVAKRAGRSRSEEAPVGV